MTTLALLISDEDLEYRVCLTKLINKIFASINDLIKIETTATLESFRRFLIISTCKSFMPESYQRDPEVFPEREKEPGSIYIEAVDKVTLKKMGEITFVNARDVLGIIYSSKSGNTKLKWRQVRKRLGKVTGIASGNALVNLVEAGIITREWLNAKEEEEKKDSLSIAGSD